MPTNLHSSAGETNDFEIGPIERDEVSLYIAQSNGTVFTTPGPHGYSTDDEVRIEGHLGNPLNGRWAITVLSPTTFSLVGASSSFSGGATGTVTKVSPIDLTASNASIEFTAKETLDAATPFLQKGSELPLTGVVMNSPSSSRKNLATVQIDPDDTADLEESVNLYYDIWLEEPDGRRTRVDHGIWKIAVAV